MKLESISENLTSINDKISDFDFNFGALIFLIGIILLGYIENKIWVKRIGVCLMLVLGFFLMI
jgi:hypothetical protein